MENEIKPGDLVGIKGQDSFTMVVGSLASGFADCFYLAKDENGAKDVKNQDAP